MPISTQASQLRLKQRIADTGWISPELKVEQSSLTVEGQWIDATPYFTRVGSALTVTGNIVDCNAVFRRISGTPGAGNIYRLSFPNREDSLQTPQLVGQLALRVVDPESAGDYLWAIYDLVGTPDGLLQVPGQYDLAWPIPSAQDILQFTGSWFIEE
jgi:hypothetical protein